MANDTVTSRPRCLFVQLGDDPKLEWIGKAHLIVC